MINLVTDINTSLYQDCTHGATDQDSVIGPSENMHQKLTLLTTGMYDLQHTQQSHPKSGCRSRRQQCHTYLSNYRPQLLTNHHILTLTAMFQDAIQENNIFKLTATNNQYAQSMKSNLDFLQYDCSNLRAAHKLAMQILNSAATAVTSLL